MLVSNKMMVLLLTLGALEAQRDVGAILQRVEIAGGAGWLSQVSEGPRFPGGLAHNTHVIEWRNYVALTGSTAVVDAILPFDIPGDSFAACDGSFIVSGRDRATNVGFIVRLQLTSLPSAQIHVESSLSLGVGADPLFICHNKADGLLYVLDDQSDSILIAPWNGGSLSSPFSSVAFVGHHSSTFFSLYPNRSSGISLGFPRHGTQPFRQVSVEFVDGRWVSTNRESILSGPAVSWSVLDPQFQGISSVTLGNASGAFDIVRAGDGSVVFSAISGTHASWQSFSLPSGVLEVGETYRIVGSDHERSPIFTPSYRFGASTSLGGVGVSEGFVLHSRMFIGNDGFGVRANVTWNLVSPPPDGDVVSLLAIGTPGTARITLPTGQTIMMNPVVTDLDIGLPLDGGRVPLFFGLPIPNDPTLDGGEVVFQFVVITPSGGIVVSDIFGSIIHGSGVLRTSTNPRERGRALESWMSSVTGNSSRACEQAYALCLRACERPVSRQLNLVSTVRRILR